MREVEEALRDTRLQPPKPGHYILPPLVQPNWRIGDLRSVVDRQLPDLLAAELCAHYGVKHCLLLDRARSGLYLLARVFGADGEWISTSMMHRPASVLLKQYCSALSFADVDEEFTIDPSSAEHMISAGTCAILATHTYGKAADVIRLRALADEKGLLLVENAVHMASGFSVRGRPIGTWGDATLLSFNVDKPLGGLLGGALLTNRDDIWKAVASHPLGKPNWKEVSGRVASTFLAYRLKPILLRLPMVSRYKEMSDGVAEIEHFSMESYVRYLPRRSHSLQMAAALACLKREQDMVAARRRNAVRLVSRLEDIPSLMLPVSTPERPHSYTYFSIVLKKGSRFELGLSLAKAGIETKWRYHPLHLEAGFADCRRADLSRTESLWARHLLLPSGGQTSERQIDYLSDCVCAAIFKADPIRAS